MCQQIKKNGFGIVEMLVAMGIFLILVLGGSIFLTQGFNINRLSDQETQATYYAAEGLEAVRSIANQTWPSLDVGNSNCNGTLQKGVTVPTTTWAWSGFPQTKSGFSRTITLGNVCRDGSGDISAGGSVYDANVKKITSTVNWSFSPTRNNTVSLTNYLSNYEAVIIGNWAIASTESTFDLTGTTDGLKIGVSGDFAYIIRPGVNPNLSVINISTTTPSLAGSINLTGNPTNIFVLGSFAYVASDSDTSELQIINISNPASPTLAGTYNAAGTANGTNVFVRGTTAYLTQLGSGSPEFTIINVSNPAAPTTVGSLNLNGSAMSVVVLGNSAAVASTDNNSELQVVNITNPATPTLTGTANLGGTSDAGTIAGSGNSVMLGRLDGTVSIIDISFPFFPILTSTFGGAGGAVNDVALGNNGNYMFLATSAGNAEFQVVDISNLSSPVLLDSINLASSLNGIFYDPNYDRAFAASQDSSAELIVFKPQLL